MRKSVTLKAGEVPSRLTRARAVALSTSGQLPPMKEVAPGTQNQKQPLRANSKRAVSDVTYLPHKKRAILQDVTNNCSGNTNRSCLNPTEIQVAYIQYLMLLVLVLKCIDGFRLHIQMILRLILLLLYLPG
jgi:hypothetical protein